MSLWKTGNSVAPETALNSAMGMFVITLFWRPEEDARPVVVILVIFDRC